MLLHPLNGPEEISGSRSAPGKFIADPIEIFLQQIDIVCRQIPDSQGNSQGSGNADGRGASDRQILNSGNNILVVPASYIPFLSGKDLLIDHHNCIIFPKY